MTLIRILCALLLASATIGCQDMARGVSKIYGIQGDPFPGSCTSQSWEKGVCVKAGVQEGKP
jgi:hypothetical protein